MIFSNCCAMLGVEILGGEDLTDWSMLLVYDT